MQITENKLDNLLLYEKILKEKEARANEPINLYNKVKGKIHNKQLRFHKSKKRNRWVFGGNRTGKSECGAVEVVWMALGVHPYRDNRESTVGWVVSLSTRVQKDVAQKKILHYLSPRFIKEIVMNTGSSASPENGVIDRIIVKNASGGESVIAFKSCEEGRDKFQGASLDYVWFDEEPPKDIYLECVMRVLDKCGDIIGTMTPLKGLSFVYDEIYLNPRKDKEIFTIFFEWKDNPFLSKKELKRLENTLSPEELEARKYGHFTDGKQGMVYPEFSEHSNVISPIIIPYDWQVCLSIDPGFNNPTSCHWYAVDNDNNIYVVAEHYEKGKTVSYHAEKIKEISNALSWRREQDGSIYSLIDTASTQRTLASIKSVADLFLEEGIKVNPKVNKNLFDGIAKVKELLKGGNGKPKLYIFDCCVNLIRELKGYMWGDRDVPIKKDDHSLDELRYFIMHYAPRKKQKEEISDIQKDKMRLSRSLRGGY